MIPSSRQALFGIRFSIIFRGAIGPQRFFGIGSVYQNLLWCFALGLVLPFFPWLANRAYPWKYWQHISVTLLVAGGMTAVGPASYQTYMLVGLFIAWFFQYYMKKYHNEWWRKYNYILAVALDTGTGLAILAITYLKFSVQMPDYFGKPNPVMLDNYC